MTKKNPTVDELAIAQPSLPSLELPQYHGRTPVGMRTSLTGAGTRITSAHGIDDRVVLVIEGRVKHAGHDSTDDGLVYVEKIKAVDVFELDTDQGSRLLALLRSTHNTAADAASGRAALPLLGDVGYTDASGVVLTPAEVASLRGDPIRVLVSDELTPAVIVLENGLRRLWPEEFPPNAPRPYVGEVLDELDSAVAEVLHTITGEPIGAPAPAPLDDTIPPPSSIVCTPTFPDVDELGAEIRSAETATAEALAGTWEAGYSGELADDPSLDEVRDDNVVPFPARPAEPGFGPADVELVDRPVAKLTAELANVIDLEVLDRLVAAEMSGRGRGLKWRTSAIDAIEARRAQLVSLAASEAARVDRVEEW